MSSGRRKLASSRLRKLLLVYVFVSYSDKLEETIDRYKLTSNGKTTAI